MAVSVVSNWESGLGPVQISYLLVSDWICFRTSLSSLGINLSLQNHSFGAKLVEIEESATRHANKQMGLSPWSSWQTNYLLQIFLFYSGLKPTDTFHFSQIVWNECLARNSSPTDSNISLNVSLKHFSVWKIVSILFLAVFKEISVDALLCSIDCPQLPRACRIQVECSFPIYLVSPASFLSGKNLALICDVLESWYSKEIQEI